MTQTIERVFKLIKYNRDWLKYSLLRWGSTDRQQPLAFRLRNGQNLQVFADARWVLNEIYLDHVYDVPGVDISRCTSVLDLGANAGTFALYVQSVSPQANVYCFEPAGKNYDLLTRNLAANHVNGKRYKLAVSAELGTACLMTGGASVAYSIIYGSGSSETVQTIDMAEVFAMTGVERFDFVKIDVEGAELGILASCSDEQLKRMRAISMEWHHSVGELQKAVERLRSIGFEASAEVGHQVRYLKARMAA